MANIIARAALALTLSLIEDKFCNLPSPGPVGDLDLGSGMRYLYPVALSVELPEDVEARLAALAQKTGRTKAFYIREAVLEHLEDLEDYYLAIERTQNPEGESVSLDDVIARLGLITEL